MSSAQKVFSRDFIAGFNYFRDTKDKAGMEAYLHSHVEGLRPRSDRPRKPNDRIAFAFDVDGVLLRSKVPLPGAKETIEFLQRNHISFIFLTNGGGRTEKEHVALLSDRLGVANLFEHQFVQAHSPFRNLLPSLAEKNVLVIGGVGNTMREVAQCYGFKHVLTPSDIYKEDPTVYPHTELTAAHHLEHGADITRGPDGHLKISAIMIWASPREWGLELQIIMDLLLSEKGYLGTVSSMNGDIKLPNRGYLQDEQPNIYFCNPDLTFATSFKQPRNAQGCFKAALEGVFSARTEGAQLRGCKSVGKPTEETFSYGEKTLMEWDKRLHGEDQKIGTVYMIGDNPTSDIRGANSFTSTHGTEWKSILVESGIHVAGAEPAHKPNAIMKGAREAVEWALWDSRLSDLGPIPSDKGSDLSPSSSTSK
jgi:HAD superfamily hydrolase (TIGR01456 family)